ncbi:MAG TPA: four helix bundle protein [Vicinamibacterales bacterium]|nr:four helix bundle protein [Vicinamibacterales bacterium]
MARRVQDLECWRLADDLRSEVHAICAQPAVTERRRFCDGFSEAAGSVCRNISEGFDRFDSGPIVQFFGYALASLAEVEDYLRESLSRRFIVPERYQKDLDLAEHTRATMLNFKRYHETKLRQQGKRPHRARRT